MFKKYENGGDPKRQGLPGNLQQLIDWTILQHGLFKTPDTKPKEFDPFSQAPSNSDFGQYNWMNTNTTPTPTVPKPLDPTATMQMDPAQNSQYSPILPGKKEKKKPTWGGYIAPALSFIDHLIPEGRIKQPVVRPAETYNPNPYGTGSQALYKNGGTLKAYDGLSLNGGGDEDPKAPRRLQPAEMQQWNQYLDFVKQRGLQGSKDLDIKSKNLGASLFNEFKKQNSNITIDYSIVPLVQNEFHQLQKTAQAFDKRKGNQNTAAFSDISKVDNWFGSITSQQYFPSMELQTFKNGQLVNRQDQGLVDGSLTPVGTQTASQRLGRKKPRYGDVGAVELEDGTMVWADELPKMKNGGKMKKGKKAHSGYTLMEGQTYDLSHEQIKSLLQQGYQLDFE